ncbi:hypothetical protein [Clostridium sp. SM-530-WT-3G]|nr:hypothetical protein [Clostridium sp. SM-530-WT-3G]NME84194.1 hypothetical protein [Clostridium sp. SM-530-WT-3G]
MKKYSTEWALCGKTKDGIIFTLTSNNSLKKIAPIIKSNTARIIFA